MLFSKYFNRAGNRQTFLYKAFRNGLKSKPQTLVKIVHPQFLWLGYTVIIFENVYSVIICDTSTISLHRKVFYKVENKYSKSNLNEVLLNNRWDLPREYTQLEITNKMCNSLFKIALKKVKLL